MNGQTNGKSPHSTGLHPLSGPLPKTSSDGRPTVVRTVQPTEIVIYRGACLNLTKIYLSLGYLVLWAQALERFKNVVIIRWKVESCILNANDLHLIIDEIGAGQTTGAISSPQQVVNN